MKVIMMGNIADALVSTVKLSLPYVKEDILSEVVKSVLPSQGIVIETTQAELKGNENLNGILCRDVKITKQE